MTRTDGSQIPADEVEKFKESISGELITKGEVDAEKYNAAIARWNMLHVKEANFIVFPESEEDVSKIIGFANKHNIDVAISAGRHTYSGPSSGNGLVIDLRKLRSLSLDQTAKTITAAGGCLAGELEKAADEVGLRANFGTVNETGIGGITTGGGIGPLTGQYGLVCDSLLSARVALADGSIVVASGKENEDLFWAIRGGGSNFGICTEFTYQLYPSRGDLYTAAVLFRPDQLRDCCNIANELYNKCVVPSHGRLALLLAVAPLAGPHAPFYNVIYDGPEAEAKALLAPLFALEPVAIMDGMKPYPAVTSYEPLKPMYAPDFDRIGASSGQMPYPLNPDVLVQAAEELTKVTESKGGKARSLIAFDLRSYAKVAEKAKNATAYYQRIEGCVAMIEFMWNDSSLDEEMLAEARRIAGIVRKSSKSRDDEAGLGATTLYAIMSDGKEKMASVYGGNLPRLRELKRKYDPNSLWNKWYPIEPAAI